MHSWKALFQVGMALHGRGCCEGLLACSERRLIGENRDRGSFRASCEKREIKKPLWLFLGLFFFPLLCLGCRSGTSHKVTPVLSPSVHVPLPLGIRCPSCHTSQHRREIWVPVFLFGEFFHQDIPSGRAGRSHPPAGTSLCGSLPLLPAACCLLFLPAKRRGIALRKGSCLAP